jgi:hypothetical protein
MASDNFYHFLFCWATGISQQLASTVGLHATQYFRTTPQFETGDARYSWSAMISSSGWGACTSACASSI